MILSPIEWETILLSLQVGAVCVLVSLPFAVGLGWVLARISFPGKLLLDGICHLPLVLPPVVTGYFLLILLSPSSSVGAFLAGLGLSFAFNWKGAALASAVVGFPLMLRAIRLAFEGVDARIEQAARTLGAGPFRTFWTITLRLGAPGLLVGSLLSFARSLGEFGATITFVSNIPGETRTLPLSIFTFLSQPGGEASAMRLALVSVVLSLAALLVSEVVARRMKGA